MAYMLLCGFAPFDAEDDNELEIFDKITKGKYSMDTIEWTNIAEEPKNFVRQTLTFDPKQRPSAHELIQHSWFSLKPENTSLRSSTSKRVAYRLLELSSRSKSNPNLKVIVSRISKASSLTSLNE